MGTNADILEKLDLIADSLSGMSCRLDNFERRMRSMEAQLTVLSAVVKGHSVHIGESISSTPVPPPPKDGMNEDY
jgi:hypothetical protein